MTLDSLTRQHYNLGLAIASRILLREGHVRELRAAANDIVQRALLRLVERGARDGDRLRGLFAATVKAETHNYMRDFRPIELGYKPELGSRRSRLTGFFPTQVFGMSLRDVGKSEETEELYTG